ncbi:MAG TPA: Ig-like domain-containing protein, partial [Candidatus Competibacteraceae bacterium]|nr:Ig-like domain-containing protein [Candidatus Competibacteraceae bacterium]
GVLGNGSGDASAVIPVQVVGSDGNGFLNLGQVTPSPQPEDNNETVLTLEDPVDGSTYSKTASISGWVVSPSGVSLVELYIDDTLQGQIPLGVSRPEIGSIYLDYPNAAQSGFSQAFNYAKLKVGSHTISVQATDNAGQKRDASATINVVRSACKYKLSLESGAFLGGGGDGTIKVRATSGCAWTAKSNASWISILSGASGEQRGTVQYRVEANRECDRIGTIAIAERQHRISQRGDPGTCGGAQ